MTGPRSLISSPTFYSLNQVGHSFMMPVGETGWLGVGRTFLQSLVFAVVLAAVGCSYGITVRPVEHDLLSDFKASVVGADEISPRTRQTLRRLDLEPTFDKSAIDAYIRLEKQAIETPQPDLLFALAEISQVLGRKAEEKKGHEACVFYFLSAGYAYHYLFDQDALAGNSFDPRFRLACDLYNNGLAKCIRSAQKMGPIDPRHELKLQTPDGNVFALAVDQHDFPWKPEEFGPLLFCSDYEVVGLANHYRGYGLGVALIGTRLPDADAIAAKGKPIKLLLKSSKSPDQPRPALRYPREVSFPVTAFFRFEGSVADLRKQRNGKLDLYNPFVTQTVTIGSREIPLETDLTTPLAYFLSRTDLEGIEYQGLFNADQFSDRTGIYMFEPYQPGKIPVVMVHGLISSPLTWTWMFNDLRADPELRKKFQFWFYLYPTGAPYIQTAADLRQMLVRLCMEVDPHGKDPALDHMVLVGHSMGGLVSKLLTESSGEEFWKLVSNKPFDDLKVSQETRSALQRTFFFERQPYVQRVVFIGTPHHGSALSPSPPVRVVNQFIRLPKTLMTTAGDVAKADPQLFANLRDRKISTSLDMLAPGAPALELLATRPKPPNMRYHSIIGEIYGKAEEGTDGVVPYKSAHIPDADSEVVVPANHSSVHQHPRAVLEVKRILEEHLREVERNVVPAVYREEAPLESEVEDQGGVKMIENEK